MSKRIDRLGETRRNKQGLTMRIEKYYNNKNIVIRFLETGETRKATYYRFKKGSVTANLLEYPVGNECTFNQAKWITVGFGVLAVGLLACLAIYLFIK